MLVRDIYDRCKRAIGNCNEDLVFERITDAVKMLATSGDSPWEGLIGELIVAVDDSGIVTLPRDVRTPLSISVNGFATFPRDRWFEYHVNGVSGGSKYAGAWDDVGFSPIVRSITDASNISVTSESAVDNDVELIIKGIDDSGRNISVSVLLDSGSTVITSEKFSSITSVHKPVTNGWVKISIDDDDNTLLGWYYPDETNPMYRRIRVGAGTTAKIIYRYNVRDLRSLDDFIPLVNVQAIVQAVKAVTYYDNEKYDMGDRASSLAYTFLSNEQNSININNSPVSPQVLDVSSQNSERLFY